MNHPHQSLEQLTDAAAYETLATQNPGLLTAVKAVMGQGVTAAQLEKWVAKQWGKTHFIGLLVTGAAHFMEDAKEEKC